MRDISTSPYLDASQPPAVTVIVQGGGGTTCAPTFTLLEREERVEALIFKPTLPESRQQKDNFTLKPTYPETVNRGDAYRLPSISVKPPETRNVQDVLTFKPTLPEKREQTDNFILNPIYPEKVNRSESLTFKPTLPETVNKSDVNNNALTWPAQTPSASPNNDAWGDAWIDGLVANQGTNHGTTSPLTVSNATAATEQRGLIEIDLTRFVGFSANGNSTLSIVVTNASAVLTTRPVAEFCTLATRPFVEGTVAWNTTGASSDPPFGSTSVVTFTPTIAAGATNVTVTYTLSAANINAMLGKWVVILLKADSTSTGYTVVSREGASANVESFKLNITR